MKNLFCCCQIVSVNEKPSRTFWYKPNKRRIDHGRDHLHTHHPSPCIITDIAQQVIGKKSYQDPKHDIELIESNQFAAVVRRSNFRNIGWSCNCRCTNGKPSNKSEKCKTPWLLCQRRTN